eukprot:gene4504-4757_t
MPAAAAGYAAAKLYVVPITLLLALSVTQLKADAAAAVVAAAEAAMARALQVPTADVKLSKTFFFFCTPGGKLRSCESGWDIESALDVLDQQQVPLASCVNDTDWEALPDPQSICTRPLLNCSRGTDTSRGLFKWRRLNDMWAAQDHVRQHVGVVTQVTLHLNSSHHQNGGGSTDGNHLLTFYKSNPPTAVYSMAGVDEATFSVTDGHAVVLIGYDNQKRNWLVQSSWGPAFGDRGSYWNPFTVSGIAPADELYVIQFFPFNPVQRPAGHIEKAARPGCFHYITETGDYLQLVATHLFGVQLDVFLQDNLGEVQTLEQLLPPGFRLLVCGGTTPAAAAAAEQLQVFSPTSTKMHFSQGPPVGIHPGLGAANSTAHARHSTELLELLTTLSSFDGRLLYLAYGPLSKLCVWHQGWLVALQLVHGTYTGPTQGEFVSGGSSRVQKQCMSLALDERVVKLRVAGGQLLYGMTLTTNTGRVISLGNITQNANPTSDLTFSKEFAAPPGGYLAGLSGWLFKVGYGDGNGWYDALCGLRAEWVVGSS